MPSLRGKTFVELLATCESTCAWHKGNNLLKTYTMNMLAATPAEVATADGAAPTRFTFLWEQV